MQIINEVKLDFDDVLLVPQKSTIKSRADVDLFTNGISDIIPNVIPVIASNMNTVGCFSVCKALNELGLMTCLHKHYQPKQYVDFFDSLKVKNNVFYSLGISDNDIQKMRDVYEQCGIKNICLDVANSYIPQTLEVVNKIKKYIPDCVLMVGNIATPDIIEDFAKCGVSILKVGIGSGRNCSTRLVAGIGIPQFSCVVECSEEAARYGIKTCSDGGCRHVSDVVKAFAGGASMVMLGAMLSGHKECEGDWVEEPEFTYNEKKIPFLTGNTKKKYLIHYGMSSREAMEKYNGGVAEYRASEGICTKIPYKGDIKDTVLQILGGLRSACSYMNASTLKDISNKAKFVLCNRTHSH